MNKNTHAELKEFHTLSFFREGGTEAQAQRLGQALNASPMLAKNINHAVSSGVVEGFRVDKNPNNNGSYSPSDEMIRLSPKILNDRERGSLGNLVFVAAHETRHSLDGLGAHYQKINAAMEKQAQQAGLRNYTDEVKAHVRFLRDAEARAEIDGFNAVVDMVRQRNPKPTLKQIYKAAPGHMHDFIKEENDRYTLKSNLQLNQDMTLPMNAKNIEGMGVNFFDKTKYFAIDYPDRYASYTVQLAMYYEQKHHGKDSKVYLDMKELGKMGIDEASLKKAGVDFNGINTTPPKQAAPNQPAAPETADQLQARMDAMLDRINRSLEAYRQNDAEAIRAANAEMIAASPTAQKMLADHDAFTETLRQQQEQENRLYSLENMPERAQMLHGRIHEKFTAYVQEHNLPYTERGIQNSVAAITAEAYAKKLSDIDDLVVNNGRLSVKQEGRVVGSYAWVDADKVASTPERESFKETLLAEQNLAREAEQREMARQAEQSRGMGMSR
ncbi:hypothetical protein [Neisseria dentiae]|uniref:hypothetical protein n=1 Tax=Neisseria dentiae TaxID=194197 RepID=UPI0035A0629F